MPINQPVERDDRGFWALLRRSWTGNYHDSWNLNSQIVICGVQLRLQIGICMVINPHKLVYNPYNCGYMIHLQLELHFQLLLGYI
jgi:hypothetical protein